MSFAYNGYSVSTDVDHETSFYPKWIYLEDVGMGAMPVGLSIIEKAEWLREVRRRQIARKRMQQRLSTGKTPDQGNSAPTDIALSNSALDENIDTTGGYLVGTLSTTDADAGDTATYSINGGTDAANFSIANTNELHIDDGTLDYETKSSYSVEVRVTDSGSNTYDETFTITINDLLEWDFTDDFDRANSSTVGNGWTEGSSGRWSIVSNICETVSSASWESSSCYRASTENNVEVRMEYKENGSNSCPQLWLCHDGVSGSPNGYIVQPRSDGTIRVYRAVNGGLTTLHDTALGEVPDVNTTYRITASYETDTIYVALEKWSGSAWTSLIAQESVEDSTHTSGYVGFLAHTGTGHEVHKYEIRSL